MELDKIESAPAEPDAPPERSPALTGGPKPVFRRELYWFTVICLGGWILAMALLVPRLASYRETRDMEESLQGVVTRLSSLEREYEAAIAALENDGFYRDEVYRRVLKVKKPNEEFILKKEAGVSDN